MFNGSGISSPQQPNRRPLYSPLNIRYPHTPSTAQQASPPSGFGGLQHRSPRPSLTPAGSPFYPMTFTMQQASPPSYHRPVMRRNSYNGVTPQGPSTPAHFTTMLDNASPPALSPPMVVTPRIQFRPTLSSNRRPSFTPFAGPSMLASPPPGDRLIMGQQPPERRNFTAAAPANGYSDFTKSNTTSFLSTNGASSSSTRPAPRTPETVASTPPPEGNGRPGTRYTDAVTNPRAPKKVSFVLREDASDAGSSPRIPSECSCLPAMTPATSIRHPTTAITAIPRPFATSPGGHLLMRAKTASYAECGEMDSFRNTLAEVMCHPRRVARLAEEVSISGVPTTPAGFRSLVAIIVDRLSSNPFKLSLESRLFNRTGNSVLSAALPDKAAERLWSRIKRDGAEYGPTGVVESVLVLLHDTLATRECRGSLVVGRRLKEYYTVSDQCVGGGAYGTVRFCWPNVRRAADIATPMATPGGSSGPNRITEDMRMMRQRSAGVHATPSHRTGGSAALGPRKSPDVVSMSSRSCRVVKSIFTLDGSNKYSSAPSSSSSGIGVVLLGEIGAMLRLDHPCIVKMHEYFHGPSGIHIIMDRVPGITLSVALAVAKSQGTGISFEEAVEIVHRLTLAVAHTYSRKIIHKDIKLCNIVVNGLQMQHSSHYHHSQQRSSYAGSHTPELTTPSDEDEDEDEDAARLLRLRVTLLDFGFAETLTDSRERRSKAEGSPMYAAPEVFERNFGLLCDSWSLGVVAYSLFTGGGFPFQCSNVDELTNILLRSDYHDLTKQPWHAAIQNCVFSVDPTAADFVFRCLQRDESKRYSAPQLVHHELLIRRPSGMISGSAAHLLPEQLFEAAFNFARAPTDHREAHRLVASRTSVGSNSSRLSRFFLQLAAPTHGHIAVDEMERAFSQHTNPETARDLVVQLRKDGRGHIGFSEFVAAVTYRCLPIDPCLSDEIYRYVLRHSDHHGHYSTLRRYLHSSRTFMK
ncbi:hypothetical protein FOL46_001835 [Perkinsus olseni]|uniref:Protein kinase domain-containing protein n=1 Tax=Perkinsus olseni TaxID=32597 RepID=A0A7J6MAW2_PEROL|nr:hypothetical protein FOL46_001835 [Perkinsus olseni]